MSLITMLLILWAGLTTILVVLLIYKGTLTNHEDDQLFLDEAESHLRKEQEELQARLSKLQPYVRFFGAGSGLVLLAMAGIIAMDVWNRL